MKVLVTVVPQTGHVNPLMPLTKALVDQGDDVVVATGPDGVRLAGGAGARVVAVGSGFDSWWKALAARTRGVPGDGLPPERVLPYFVPRLFAEAGTLDMVDDLLRFAKEFEPDVIMHDGFCFAAPLVAKSVGARAVHHTIGPAIAPPILELCTDALSPVWRSLGHEIPPFGGIYSGVTISICPEAVSPGYPPIARDVRPLRSTPAPLKPSQAPLPDPLRRLAGRPLVYITLGTFSNRNVAFFRAVLDALATEPLDVVVTVGSNNDPAELDPIPENIVVERYLPQELLLPRCAAVVHHAGSGTMFGALAHGLPQLAIPQGADNFINAELLERAGAGRRLAPGEVSVDALRAGVRKILDDASYRAAASRVAAQMAAMPSAPRVAAGLRDE